MALLFAVSFHSCTDSVSTECDNMMPMYTFFFNVPPHLIMLIQNYNVMNWSIRGNNYECIHDGLIVVVSPAPILSPATNDAFLFGWGFFIIS